MRDKIVIKNVEKFIENYNVTVKGNIIYFEKVEKDNKSLINYLRKKFKKKIKHLIITTSLSNIHS